VVSVIGVDLRGVWHALLLLGVAAAILLGAWAFTMTLTLWIWVVLVVATALLLYFAVERFLAWGTGRRHKFKDSK